jgi:6-phosphogluconolactonase
MAGNDHRQANIKASITANIHVIAVSDSAALANAAAERVLARIAANPDRVAICLTGGSSPKQLYRLLATDAFRSQIPWHRVHWFIGDERFVAAEDPLNNMAMARQIFLDRCAPAANIHPIPTDAGDPEQAAHRYERELKSFYGASELDSARPLFDVVLMGIGPDGHTASLFPNDPAVEETAPWVVGVPQAPVAPLVPRVTLTLPALGSCREMLFEVAGSEKRAILARVLDGEHLPANRARSSGETIWLVDTAALPENFRAR